jgi:hypothetical protein
MWVIVLTVFAVGIFGLFCGAGSGALILIGIGAALTKDL